MRPIATLLDCDLFRRTADISLPILTSPQHKEPATGRNRNTMSQPMTVQNSERDLDAWVSVHRCIFALIDEDLQPYPGMDAALAVVLAERLKIHLEKGDCRRYFESTVGAELGESAHPDACTRHIEHQLYLLRDFILYLETLE